MGNTLGALYFESHVTIDPVTGPAQIAKVARIASARGFRVADLVKNTPTFDQPNDRDMFMTHRGVEFQLVEQRTKALVRDLIECGYKVRRYKIEFTLLDSKLSDVFGLLKEGNDD